MLMDGLGRGPILFRVINVATALDEEILDLPMGARGFRIKDRANAAVLRYSNVKGEVGKASTATPKPQFWTVGSGIANEGILGIRVMAEDATTVDADGNPIPLPTASVEAGAVLEQRFYVTSETDDTDIEITIYPGV